MKGNVLKNRDFMNQRKIRDLLRLLGAILFFWLYVPHLIAYAVGGANHISIVIWRDIKVR